MQDYFKNLTSLNAQQNEDGVIHVEYPVVIETDFTLAELDIFPNEQGYLVVTGDNMFTRHNDNAKYYIDLFEQYGKNCHYGIALNGDVLQKQYSGDFNVRVAVNEFIRYLIYFDDFMLTYDVIGNGDKYLKLGKTCRQYWDEQDEK
ncbi:MAG: hypothetical protein IJV77_00225 [Clostridia bacterium]|nr:hypothetical protein [Clostridia bacterium]